MTNRAPRGMWVIDSRHDLTYTTMQRAQELLQEAANNGHQVVVVDGIEFKWRPMPDGEVVTNSSDSGWCPSCTCGWHKPIDAFDVTPPEAECRNTVCQCHSGFWDTDPVHVMPDESDELGDELTKRRLWGDR